MKKSDVGWQVAIPSYARSDGLKKWTLATLRRGGVPADRITVFVANAEQRDLYEKTLDPETYESLVVAEPGIREARNFISRYYPDGARVMNVDDDLRRVCAGVNGRLVEIDDLCGLFDAGFEACERVKARLWGVYPVCSAFYMKGVEVTTDLRPVIGALHGHVNDRTLVLQCNGGKEDIERTILYFEKDHAIVRFNRVAADQPPHAPGGLQATNLRTAETALEAAQYLCNRWPRWVKMKKAFARGHAEVRLSSK